MQRVPIVKRDRVVAHALVDDADAALVLAHRWRLHPYGYAQTGSGATVVLLHRLLLGAGDPREVDHVDRNPLNCQRANMRLVTHAQNMQNVPSRSGSTSSYRGVSWAKHVRKWQAQAKVDGRASHLGYFVDEAEAAAVAAEYRRLHMTHATG